MRSALSTLRQTFVSQKLTQRYLQNIEMINQRNYQLTIIDYKNYRVRVGKQRTYYIVS